jgi:hypothetical protein
LKATGFVEEVYLAEVLKMAFWCNCVYQLSGESQSTEWRDLRIETKLKTASGEEALEEKNNREKHKSSKPW